MNRRRFLESLGIGTLALAGGQLISPSAGLPYQQDDFIIARRLPRENLHALESLLAIPPQKPLEKNIKIVVERYPELIYHCRFWRDKDNPPAWNARELYAGATFLLDKSGVFISAHHLFADHFIDTQEGRKDCMMVLYDPSSDTFGEAVPFIYSKKYDLLLGKASLPQGTRVARTFISASNEPPLNHVYITKYQNIDYITKDLFRKTMLAGELELAGENKRTKTRFIQARSVQKEGLKHLDVAVSLGKLKDVTGLCEATLDKEEYAFVASTRVGNSGSPIFDVNNNLMGVLNKANEEGQSLQDPQTGEKFDIGIYTGPSVIRRMIKTYINVCS